MAVDYLSRYVRTGDIEKAFDISLKGIVMCRDEGGMEIGWQLLSRIDGLSDESIDAALRLTGFDVCYRSDPAQYRPVQDIDVDQASIANVRTMVERVSNFVDWFGPVIDEEPIFSAGIVYGDGDMVTANGIWDLKVLKDKPKPKHTLQILMYWRMGLCSKPIAYGRVRRIGIFNPRSNEVWFANCDEIDPDMIKVVERDVIGILDEGGHVGEHLSEH